MVGFETDIKNCIKALEEGGTILYPTDTVWGLGCDALNETAIDKVFALKNRSSGKSLIVLLAEARDILRFVAAPPADIIEIVESFERPTTIIYEHALEFPENALSEDGSVAMRVVNDPFCKALIKRFRKPIVSTSANLSGEPTPANYSLIDSVVKQRADYIVQYRQNDQTYVQPSRLIKLNDDGSWQTLRP
jgi:L-threonylcarbamoyladenylate synthase